MSKYTKACIAKKWACLIIDWLILIAPVLSYFVYGFMVQGISTFGYFVLIGCAALAAIIYILNLMLKYNLKCPIWILLLGIYVALGPIVKSLLPLFLMMAVAVIIDELILTPLIKHYRTEIIANKAIDKREK